MVKTCKQQKTSPIPPAPAQVTAPLLSPEEEAAIPEALTAGVLRIRKAQVDDVNPGLINPPNETAGAAGVYQSRADIRGGNEHRCGTWIGIGENHGKPTRNHRFSHDGLQFFP